MSLYTNRIRSLQRCVAVIALDCIIYVRCFCFCVQPVWCAGGCGVPLWTHYVCECVYVCVCVWVLVCASSSLRSHWLLKLVGAFPSRIRGNPKNLSVLATRPPSARARLVQTCPGTETVKVVPHWHGLNKLMSETEEWWIVSFSAEWGAIFLSSDI